MLNLTFCVTFENKIKSRSLEKIKRGRKWKGKNNRYFSYSWNSEKFVYFTQKSKLSQLIYLIDIADTTVSSILKSDIKDIVFERSN